ncbi:alanine dehydrogenase [uncultured Alistipes sp.]|uniref:alanine dehydrogenase n=1 Tax=uncultured Alistipes sp. TaxID=538949 RepID=UPI0026652D91|nr:alanine dehydrogenase [uncultured Alistipes sp.]
MIIGIPKEIKNNENRVAMTPAGVQEMTRRGHKVYVQATAGVNSGFTDDAYRAVGAEILPTIEEVYATAEMIVKVKEPIAPEYKLVRAGQLLFTYFHFASSEPLTRAMIDSGAVCCAYETVERADRSLPLLTPMSEVAGRMATQEGCYFLEKPRGGKGVLLGGVPGVKPARVFVIGAGVVGTAAARMAAGLGADVTICDISLPRLTYLTDVMPRNVKTLMSSEYNIREELRHADLVIGSVLIPGAKAPKIVTRDMLQLMEPGTVLVDVAIDQGGCFETSRPTTHEDPVYYVDGILHYCVANIPGAVPRTSTLALTNATLPYAVQLADKGWQRACRENPELALGLNVVEGKVVYKPVAEAWGLNYEPLAL